MAKRDTRALVAHLFRRAGFGLRPDELDHFTMLGVQGSVDYLTHFAAVANPAESAYPVPDMTQFASTLPKGKHTTAELKAASRMRAQAKLTIQEWWVNRMLTTARPLQEKMTLFWHGHFATATAKVPAAAMLEQNQLFRAQALGNFSTLLKAVNQDPAMLLWLDGGTNRAGKPNENFSRELMELFTIGLGHFSEQDVRQGARALTGWVVPYKAVRSGDISGQGALRPRFHDSGQKTYLGHTGNLGSGDVMNILSAHPAAGPFLVAKLFTFLAYDNAAPAVLQPFIDTYYRTQYDTAAVVRQILLSDPFYSDLSFQQHIKSPVEYVLGTTRELHVSAPTVRLVQSMTSMGQDLFNPPNVGGWHGGTSWLNPGTLLSRFNFAGVLLRAQPASQTAPASTPALTPADMQIGTMTDQATVISGPLQTARSLPDATPFAPRALVDQIGATAPEALVSYLLERFLGVGATAATMTALAEYLGPDLAPDVIQTRVRNLVQLVLSTPEYQLN
jgi:uncharacterized protein (DUF1800 family)